MNCHLTLLRIMLALLLLGTASSRAQNTVFTYQGRLNLNGTPANGNYDLSFGLYATNSGGSPIGSVLTNFAVPVSNGLFTTVLQFNASFSGPSYWLDISVRTNGGGTFNELSPRQWLTPPTAGHLCEQREQRAGTGFRRSNQWHANRNGKFHRQLEWRC